MDMLANALAVLNDSRFDLRSYGSGVGGAPNFSFPIGLEGIKDKLQALSEIYTPKGVNGKSPCAEGHAIVLAQAGQFQHSREIFDAIAKDGLVGPPKYAPNSYASNSYEAVANEKGVLGYEGLFRYAKVAKETSDHVLEKRLLMMIAHCRPPVTPIRMQDVLVSALESLVHDHDMALAGQLALAKEHQY